MSALTLNDINLSVDTTEPRIQDLKLAEALGFSQPRDIRKLVQRNLPQLQAFGEVSRHRGAKPSKGSIGGRPIDSYYLNEKQALFLCTRSDSGNAIEITIEMVEVFYAVRHGGQSALPRPAGLSNSQRRAVQQRIAEDFAQEERRAVYDRLKDHFDVARYWNIPCARFEEALALIEGFTPCRKPTLEKKVMADKARLEAAIRDLIGFLHLDDNCSHGAFQDRQKIAAFLERALVSGRSSPNSSATGLAQRRRDGSGS